VAGFTPLPLAVVLRIQSKDLRMQRLAEMLVLLSVTFDASRLADVLRWLRGRLRDSRGRLYGCRLPSTPSASRCLSRSFAFATLAA
jgi:hypothetical protein